MRSFALRTVDSIGERMLVGEMVDSLYLNKSLADIKTMNAVQWMAEDVK